MKTRFKIIAAVCAIMAVPASAHERPVGAARTLASSSAAQRATAFVERGPTSIANYISSGRTPRYIRINVSNYNIRSTPDFNVDRRDNVSFRTNAGSLFAVSRMIPLQSGVAVAIFLNGQERWIFVPHYRPNDFQFCESEACFSSLAESLDILLRGTGFSGAQARSCGVGVGADALVSSALAIPPPAAVAVPPATPMPPARPLPQLQAAAARVPEVNRPVPVQTSPLWEVARPAYGANLTRLLQSSLRRHGQGLLNTATLGDAQQFCPNYATLTAPQREEFWIHLFAGIARYESGFNLSVPAFNELTRQQEFSGPILPNNHSMGLFQLSYGSAHYYRSRGCNFDWGRDQGRDISDRSLTIYDPTKQMDCAVGIMNRWVSQDGRIGSENGSPRGGARFWSTLRSQNPRTRDLLATLRRFAPCGFR